MRIGNENWCCKQTYCHARRLVSIHGSAEAAHALADPWRFKAAATARRQRGVWVNSVRLVLGRCLAECRGGLGALQTRRHDVGKDPSGGMATASVWIHDGRVRARVSTWVAEMRRGHRHPGRPDGARTQARAPGKLGPRQDQRRSGRDSDGPRR